MASLALPTKFRAFTAGSVSSPALPLVGGRLFAYEAGTTTPKDTFTDAGGGTANANPVILDARGEANVWLGTGAYRLVLQNSAGVQQWAVDDIKGGEQLVAEASAAATAAFAEPTGSSLVGWVQSGIGAVPRTVFDRMRDVLSVFDFMTPAQIAQVRAGTFTLDVTSAMNAASAAAFVAKKGLFVPSGGYKMSAPWVIAPEVHVRGESFGMQIALDPGGTFLFGAVIFKAHNGNAITKTGGFAYYAGAPIENIAVTSSRSAYPSGNAFVLDRVSNCHLIRCTAFGIGGDCFVLGVSAGDVTGHNYTYGCYSNNPAGVHYRIRSKWSRHHYPVTDGGTHGMFLQDAPETHVDGGHFEGASVAAVRLAGFNTSSKFTGKGFVGMTNPAGKTGFIVDSVPGNSEITIENYKLLGPSNTAINITFTAPLSGATIGTLNAPFPEPTGSWTLVFSDGSVRVATLTNGSTAVSWAGAVTATASAKAQNVAGSIAVDLQSTASNNVTVRNCEIQSWDIGVNDNGTSGTQVMLNVFTFVRLPIYANSAGTAYEGNRTVSTVGAWSIDHIGNSGTGGIWTQNQLDKPIKPSFSGSPGNFGTNQVIGNKGFKTSGQYVTVSGPSPLVTPHGLVGAPMYVQHTVYSGTPANLAVTSVDATNVTFTWSGGGNAQISFRAAMLCENQV